MSDLLTASGRWMTFWSIVSLTVCADAASVEGRVVDSDGKPVAGAEVRVWQRLAAPNRRGYVDQGVLFDGFDTLRTDDEGRFVSSDALVDGAFAYVVAEADGMLAGRSGWLAVQKKTTVELSDIVLRRLRAVVGNAVDRQGRAIAGATIFNAGDGHHRVEIKTGRGGKFFLAGVPEGAIFLFAEKPGDRFSGMRLPPDQSSVTFTLVSTDEAIEPLARLHRQDSPAEEIAIARKVLDVWLDELEKSGTDMQKSFALASLAAIDPLKGFDRLNSLAVENQQNRVNLFNAFVEKLIQRPEELSADKLRAIIESGNDPFAKSYQYVETARRGVAGDRARQVRWLEAARLHAGQIESGDSRTHALARIADALFSIGERARAESALSEAEMCAESLPETFQLGKALGFLALAATASDAERGVARLEEIKNDRDYHQCAREVALRLLPDRPKLAEEVWNRAQARSRPAEPGDVSHLTSRYSYLPEFCYRLAAVDRAGAERVANAAEHSAFRIRGRAAIALALAGAEPVEARELLERVVREELPRTDGDDFLARSFSVPATAAWLLPIAERVAPDLGREIFWRSLALRLPRPRREPFDAEIDTTDMELAKMLARYDRDTARALLEPIAARLPAMITAAAGTLPSKHEFAVGVVTQQPIRDTICATAHVDPSWSKDLVDAIVAGAPNSIFYAAVHAQQAFIFTLARRADNGGSGLNRVVGVNAIDAGFWLPNSD